jgi:hypothetical protein
MSMLGDLLEDRYFKQCVPNLRFTQTADLFWFSFFRVREADLLNSSKLLLARPPCVHGLPRLPGSYGHTQAVLQTVYCGLILFEILANQCILWNAEVRGAITASLFGTRPRASLI